MTATPTKKSILLKRLTRPQGASIAALVKAVGWQPHSVRAALTGLRKDGYQIERTTDDHGVATYRVGGEEGA